MKQNKYWFKPKTFGYGATPSTWEGWTVTLGFVALLLLTSFSAKENPVRFYIELGALFIVLMWFVKKKTKGQMKWSWKLK